jgi:hypothetical protein
VASILTDGAYYKNVGGINVWHNPTLPLMRPFQLLACWYFVRLIRELKQNKTDKSLLLKFGVSQLLALIAKPSGALVCAPVMFIWALFLFFKNHKQRFKPCLYLFCSILPVIIIFVIQAIVFHSDATIKFHFGGVESLRNGAFNWSLVLKNIFSINMFGILSVILMWNKAFRNEMFLMGACTLFVAVAEYWFLIEDGLRAMHGNLGWGMIFASYMFAVMAFIPILQLKSRLLKILLFSVFVLQAYFGIKYIGLCLENGISTGSFNYWF